MKKILTIIIISCFSINISFANTNINAQEIDKKSYDNYKKNVEEHCQSYKENKPVINIEDYKISWEFETWQTLNDFYILDSTIWKYKEDMNNIYKCWIIMTQINSMNLILKKLWVNNEINKSLSQRMQTQKTKLEMMYKNNKCINTDKDNLNYRLNILKQTTYETCRYNFYMEYLKDYYDNIDLVNLKYSTNPEEKPKSISAEWYNQLLNQYITKIDYEISRAYYLFPLSFHAYVEYENYFPIHILLVLIKEDFIKFREKYHKVISPINQVVYKIANAMSK